MLGSRSYFFVPLGSGSMRSPVGSSNSQNTSGTSAGRASSRSAREEEEEPGLLQRKHGVALAISIIIIGAVRRDSIQSFR